MISQSIIFPDLWTSRKPLSVKIQISRVEGSCQCPFQSWFLLCFSRPTLYSFTIMSLQRKRCVRCWREEFFLGFTVLLVIGMCLRVDGNQNTIRPQAAQFRAKVQIVLVVISCEDFSMTSIKFLRDPANRPSDRCFWCRVYHCQLICRRKGWDCCECVFNCLHSHWTVISKDGNRRKALCL